ncbi:MAG: acyl-CoA synthetase, partial [Proteobacteria bacterium]
ALERAAATALVHARGAAACVAAARSRLPRLRVVLSVDDGSGADLTRAGSEDFDSALAGAAPSWDRTPS